MRYKVNTKDCHLIVRAKTSWKEEIDEKAMDAFSRAYIKGFLKPRIIKKNMVEYFGPIGISLYERMKKPISKQEFLFVMEQLVLMIQKIQNNNLLLHKVQLDLHTVYINSVTREVQFLYLVSNVPVRFDLDGFVDSIVYSANPATPEDASFISRFTYFLKAQKTFDPDLVEKYIEKEDRDVVNTIRKQNAGQSGFMTCKQRSYYQHYEEREVKQEARTNILQEDEDPTGLLFEENIGNTMMDQFEDATGILDDENEDATGLLFETEDGEEEEGTALLEESKQVHYPTLYRVNTGETIRINKPVFRLGKERSYVDYFVTNNNAVSRSHADIITRDNKYFVVDLNSTNHTYINDQKITIKCETEICNGDRLKLGNEEFLFHT